MNKPIGLSPFRVAERFASTLANARASALDGLKADLSGMDDAQLRQCAEYLCDLLVEDDCSAEVLGAVFRLLEAKADTTRDGLQFPADPMETPERAAI